MESAKRIIAGGAMRQQTDRDHAICTSDDDNNNNNNNNDNDNKCNSIGASFRDGGGNKNDDERIILPKQSNNLTPLEIWSTAATATTVLNSHY